MKKLFSFAILLVALVFAFAGCSNTPVPSTTERWNAGETKRYEINLLTSDMALSKGFNDPEKKQGDCYEYPKNAGVQVKPNDILDGSYMEYTISKEGSNWVFDLEMSVIQKYEAAEFAEGWEEKIPQENIVGKDSTFVTLKSTMTSKAVFGSIKDGERPVSSTKTVNSVVVFYNSDLKIDVDHNDFTTTATYDESSVKSTFTDRAGNTGKPSEATVNTGSGFIFDNEAMLLAIRSVDMVTLKEAGSTSLNFYNAIEQKTQKVTVAYISDSFTFNNTQEDAPKYMRVGCTPEGMGYPYYFYFEQQTKIAPPVPGDMINQYQLAEMNQGYMNFSLAA